MAGRGAIPVQLSSDFKAAIRHDYVETDKPVREICAEFGISVGKISRLIVNENWPRRTDRPPRELPPALKLREKARVLVARSSPPPERGRSDREAMRVGVRMSFGVDPHPNPPPFRGRERRRCASPKTKVPTPPRASSRGAQGAPPSREAARRPRRRAAQPRRGRKTARTLSTLTETLQQLRRLRAGQTGAPPEQSGPIDQMTTCPPTSMNSVTSLRAALKRLSRAGLDEEMHGGIADAALVDAARPVTSSRSRIAHQEPPAAANNGGPWTTWLDAGRARRRQDPARRGVGARAGARHPALCRARATAASRWSARPSTTCAR